MRTPKSGTDHDFLVCALAQLPEVAPLRAEPMRKAAWRSKTWSVPGFYAASSVDLAEDDVLGADDRHRIGEHVPARHLVERREVREARGADLQPVGLVCA